jgi:uncharacterized protein YggT (Ycf19 family)
MDDPFARLLLVVRVVLPLLLFMASVYLALHIAFVRLIPSRDSPVLWFFSVVTGPLTRPVRALLPAGTAETRIRYVALAIYAGLWLVSVIVRMGSADPG